MNVFSPPSSNLWMLATVAIGQRRGQRAISETPVLHWGTSAVGTELPSSGATLTIADRPVRHRRYRIAVKRDTSVVRDLLLTNLLSRYG